VCCCQPQKLPKSRGKWGFHWQHFLFHHSSNITDPCYSPYLPAFLLILLNKWEFQTEENHSHILSR